LIFLLSLLFAIKSQSLFSFPLNAKFGLSVQSTVGEMEIGDTLGSKIVGDDVGNAVGDTVGEVVGAFVGDDVGDVVEDMVGEVV